MPDYAFVLPYALNANGTEVLLAQRELTLERSLGLAPKQAIPHWAGQWGLIGTKTTEKETGKNAALRALNEQAGIDGGAPIVAMRFFLGNQELLKMQLPDYSSFYVLRIFTSNAALAALAQAINTHIQERRPSVGLLQGVTVCQANEALQQKLGLVRAPPQGWPEYLMDNYYAGKRPGQLNTEIDDLVKYLEKRSQQDNSQFVLALAKLK